MNDHTTHPVPKRLGFAIIATPVLWLAAEAVSPHLEADSSAQLAVIRQHPDAWYAYTVLLVLGTMAFVPALVGLMGLARGSQRLATVGGVILGFGTLIALGDAMSQLVVWQMGVGTADPHEMAALLDRFENAGGSGVVFGLGGLSFVVGTVLLTVALIRAGSTPAWASALFAVGIVVQLAGFVANSVPVILISSVILLAGMGRQAMTVLDVERGPVAQRRTAAVG